MTLEQALTRLDALEEAQYAYGHAMGMLYIDGDTVAPRRSVTGRGKTLGYLSEASYKVFVNDEVKEALETILAHADAVTAVQRRRAEVLKEDYDEMTRIPMDEYVAFAQLSSEASAVWHEAKEKSDYPMFAPYLAKLIDYRRRFAAYKDDKKPAYDVLLDSFEKGTSMATLDPFFATLRERLTPVIHAVGEKPAPRVDFIHGDFPLWKQRILTQRVMAMMGIDPERCVTAETEHPFTSGLNKWDVRLTTHYYPEDVSDNLYSILHEGGHALYELGVDDALQFTCLGSGSSMSIHESQSRFYENYIGRSLPFCRALLPVLKELFPAEMQGVTPEMLYAAVNRAQPSLIRIQADELTYSMHVMIRYELEKLMLAGEVTVDELPKLWNDMYKQYLGVTVPNDREGILQDSHWSGVSFGYFPSYSLGSAYGAQMLRTMEKELNPWPSVEKGDFSPVTAWLGERIHRHGKLLTPAQILESAIGEPFDPTCYTDYLTRKFSKLYGL